MGIQVGEKVFVLKDGYLKQGEILRISDLDVCLVEIESGEWFLRTSEELKRQEEMTVDDWRNYGGYGKRIKEKKR